MRANVFTDKALERYAGRFVWLSINTEKAVNHDFLTKFPINVWPTLFVLDPATESVVLTYAGGATEPQLEKLLNDGEGLIKQKGTPPDKLLAAGDQHASAGKPSEAAKLYEQALAEAPKTWSRRGRASESLIFALSRSPETQQKCATMAKVMYPSLRQTSSSANVAAVGLGCASSIDATNPARRNLMETLEGYTRKALADTDLDLSGDDRSGLYESLIEAREAVADKEGARKLRLEWLAFLDGVAGRAKTAEQRAVYDSHRVSALLALGTPEKAVPFLKQSERDFPDDYNPPARLASAYRAMKKYDDALAASDRALAKAYGPRKLGILRTRSDIYLEKGEKEEARRTLAEAIAFANTLPESQRSERSIAGLKKKLEAIPQ